jgi:asparagine synthase (glutamine-hydrolysing)
MCGICGVIQISGEPRQVLDQHRLDHMTDAMAHRGPSDRGTILEPGVAIGVRRLSVVDLEGGHQPFANEDGTIWAAQNGELYNHDAVRRGLQDRGHAFRSRCDTEILPHLYEDVGTAFPERLRGMFGVVVWDRNRRRTVLARDRLGVKPLYYAVAGDLLVFASELKSLLASGLVGGDLDYEAIDAYLALGYVPSPRTPLRGVSKLPPGHRLIVEGGGYRIERFWAYPEPHEAHGDEREMRERLLEQLDEAVRIRLMADVPLGAMLSGGIDSSLIVALMARNSSGPVKTFAVGFRGEGGVNELADARRVARAIGTDHHELELDMADQRTDLAQLTWFMDEPLADLSTLGFLAVSELAAGHVTVALSGQGADELLGGYRKHRAAAIADAWWRLPAAVRGVGTRGLSHGPGAMPQLARALRTDDPADRLLAMSGLVSPRLRGELARGPLAALDGGEARRMISARVGDLHAPILPTTLYLDAQLALPDHMLHYFDRASMAHSLEVRVPFLDHHVVEFCAGIPAAMKVRHLSTTKHLLKTAARGLIPDEVIDKPKVGFFKTAVGGWFRAQTDGAIADYLLDDDPRYAEIIDPAAVRRLVARHASGGDDPVLARSLLTVLMLEVWLRTYLPRALAPPPLAASHA